MSIEYEIVTAFGLHDTPPCRTDEWIVEHPNVMEIEGDFDSLKDVPAYMLWCVRNSEREDLLVIDYTLNALAEYGRCKDANLAHLNFRHLCNSDRRRVVRLFLSWCSDSLSMVDADQLERCIRRWTE